MVRSGVWKVRTAAAAVIFALLIALGASSAKGQLRDTVCVPVEQLSEARQEVENLRRRDSLNTRLVSNYRAQVANLEAQARQDSIIIDTFDIRLSIREEQIEWRDERMRYLEDELKSSRRRRWLYFIGGAATVVLGGYAAGQAASN
jgi:uncharacterized protein (DUF3084 family)